MMKLKWLVGVSVVFPLVTVTANANYVYETKGEALIRANSAFFTKIERRNIPIPRIIDVRQIPEFAGLLSDRDSGWTKCRVPLKGELGLTGVTERELVFDCRPLK